MEYTSSKANKLLKGIESRIADLKVKEGKSCGFTVAMGEDIESVRPEYDFAATQARLDELEATARKVKHAINLFNVSHTLPGYGDLTIDQALVLIPQLTARAAKLKNMAMALPKMRVDNFRTTIVDYSIANYDIDEAERAYRAVQEQLAALQLALDEVNSTETMEIDITLN